MHAWPSIAHWMRRLFSAACCSTRGHTPFPRSYCLFISAHTRPLAPSLTTLLSPPPHRRRFLSSMKKFALGVPFKLHKVDAFPSLQALTKLTEVGATKEELLAYHESMFEIRRVEVTCDAEYKARNIRGFCHLYDGQEAICVGTEAALTREDDWLTTYRCHGVAMVRGVPASQVFAEQVSFFPST